MEAKQKSEMSLSKNIILILSVLLGSWAVLPTIGNAAPTSGPLGDTAPLVMTGPDHCVPFQFTDADGSPEGLNIDIWNLWSRKTGRKIEFRLSTWSEAIRLLEEGRADFSAPVLPSEKLRQWADFTTAYASRTYYLFHHKSLKGISRFSDLKGLHVGVVEAGLSSNFVKNTVPFGTTIIEYPSFPELAQAAFLGEIHAFAGTMFNAAHHLSKLGLLDEYRYTRTPAVELPVHACVRKEDSDLLALLDDGLSRITPEEMHALEERWKESRLVRRIPWQLVGAVLLGLSLLGCVILFWSYQLRKKVRTATSELRVTNEALEGEIREREKAEEQRKEQQAYFQQLFRNSPQATVICDASGTVLSVNGAFEKMFRYSEEELRGRFLTEFIVPEDRLHESATMRDELAHRRPTEIETVRKRKDGSRVDVSVLTFPIEIEGRSEGCYGVYVDITERKRAEAELAYHAFHDRLTGLPNRALFMDRLERAMERAKRKKSQRFAVLFLDLDRFKVVNDSLGHIVGDQLLVAVSKRLSSCVRAIDTVSRIGGDEFALLLEDVESLDGVVQVVRRIQTEVRAPMLVGGHLIHTSASIGIVWNSTTHQRAEYILRDADIAMYQAKEEGKDCYKVFSAPMRDRVIQAMAMENGMRRALGRNQFEVHYQPVLSLREKRLTGFEALLRWRHPEKGLIYPYDFIHVAEESGLIISIGLQTLKDACRQVREWQCRYPEFSSLGISVNLSAKQFRQPELSEQICELMEESGLDSRCLTLEVTESVVMENAQATEILLEELKRRKVKLSIDDFGTGYSCLDYLHRFPIDVLKVDRSFVSHMNGSGKHKEIVRTIILLAHNLSMDVVAEGVETEAQLAELEGMGCDYVQGYLFAKPLDKENAEALLKGERTLGASMDRMLRRTAQGSEPRVFSGRVQ